MNGLPLNRRRWLGGALALAAGAGARAQTPRRSDGCAKLFGMNIGAKHYDDPQYQAALGRLDIAIVGFYPGWKGDKDGTRMRRAVQSIKSHGSARVGQYTLLNESIDDAKDTANRDRIGKLDAEDWWLRRSDRGKVQWTERYKAWDINITEWAKPDRDGLRYPEWLAERDARTFFARVPEFDIWYFDNVMVRPRLPPAVWKLDGVERRSDDREVEAAFRRGMAAHWQAARRLQPGKLLVGNADSDLSAPEYSGRLDGAFLEGLMGKNWSIERRHGWSAMMERYRAVREHLRGPRIVAFNVHGDPADHAFFRYAFASSLLGDGHFSFTDDKAGYSSVPWFDEYDVPLGPPREPPPAAPWQLGVWRRRYEQAMVLVNPGDAARTVTVEPGWRRLRGTQDARANDGAPARELSLPARSGLLLTRT
jgi:hypothetical protein